MQEIYTSYECKRCRKEVVLVTEDLEDHKHIGKYVVCPYCCNKELNKEKRSDSLKEIMKARSYKRKNGAIQQK
ncbi:hypothetical protein KPL40_03875 [Clostridium gasigenes]|uniref:hypothetical protein n=1 Tax=Clostridium gasigenes TaxID=94869 RepID=UPI001C0D9C0C|nr:hypothetical protein [Clostridium gasigenes]MBU3131580.1 hypothetical protein [Clostridium gasigenes]